MHRAVLALAAAVALLVAGGAAARAGAPLPTSPPAVAGAVAAGERLQAEIGTWTSSSDAAYGYQWYRCNPAGAACLSVHGATAAGYRLSAKDVGETIGLAVTATDSSGRATAYASLVGPVAPARPLLVSTAQPQLTGLAIAGKVLQVTTGGWSPQPDRIAYAWQRCNANGRVCVPIRGARASSYTARAADVGHAVAALVRASFGQTVQDAFSTASAAVASGEVEGPSPAAPPAIGGVAEQGAQLVGSTGAWNGMGRLSYRFQWYRCDGAASHCLSIHGATGATYRLVPADVGRTIALTVEASDATGTAPAYASAVGPIAAARAPVVSAGQPGIDGSAHPGSTLRATSGVWQPSSGSFVYAWRRCNANGRLCVPIAGATHASYTATAADVGHALVAVVTTTVGPDTQSAYSAASPAVT